MRTLPPRILLLLILLQAVVLPQEKAHADDVDPAYVAGAVVVAGARLISGEHFRANIAFEYGEMSYGDLVSYTGYRFTPGGQLDEARQYRYAFEDGTLEGFRLGLRFREQLDLTWSRQWGETRYQVWVDGEEAVHDPEGAIRVQLPVVDIRIDMLNLAWRIKSLEKAGIAPTLSIGYGWLLHSQQGPFQAPFRPAVDDSASDDTVSVGVGLDATWSVLQLGAELEGFSWRYESTDPNVPGAQVWSWMWSVRAGLVF